MTRGQAASVLVALMEAEGVSLPATGAPFDDIGDSVHASAIEALAAVGVVSGVGDRRFAPERPLLRGQFTSMLLATYEHVTGGEVSTEQASGFEDIVGSAHEDAIEVAAAAGVVSGVTEDRFEPGTELSRAQATSLTIRLLAWLRA